MVMMVTSSGNGSEGGWVDGGVRRGLTVEQPNLRVRLMRKRRRQRDKRKASISSGELRSGASFSVSKAKKEKGKIEKRGGERGKKRERRIHTHTVRS